MSAMPGFSKASHLLTRKTTMLGRNGSPTASLLPSLLPNLGELTKQTHMTYQNLHVLFALGYTEICYRLTGTIT